MTCQGWFLADCLKQSAFCAAEIGLVCQPDLVVPRVYVSCLHTKFVETCTLSD